MSSSLSLTGAVSAGDENAVSALLAGGADVNERTSGGQTALILAVIVGRTDIVRRLVNAGADPEQRDNLGLNAIDWAQRRGANDAIEILTTPRPNTPPKRILINFEEPEPNISEPPPTMPEPEPRETITDAEKSNRWLSGLKQRLDEQAQRRVTSDDPPSIINTPEPEPVLSELLRPEPAAPEVFETKPPAPEVTPRAVHSTRILTPPPTPPDAGKRKRCPQCNAIYNGDLVTYCAHHIVALVDMDEQPVVAEPPKANPPMFWIMVIITLTGSIIVGSLITAYLYKTNQAAARVAADQPSIQKGVPVVSDELAGKAVSLPEAECPVRGREPVSGAVIVHVLVDKKGQVYKARGAGGDWLMRGAATEAAMKSTFSPEKLANRETEGTITYTFK